MSDWDERWMAMARLAASFSKDRSTKVGCVIVRENRVLSLGWNGFPRGIDDDVEARHERPMKYAVTEHAERNAVYNAAREGVSLDAATIYVPWFPCADCARAIIQSGIWDLVAIQPAAGARPDWAESFAVAQEMLVEADVRIRWYTGG